MIGLEDERETIQITVADDQAGDRLDRFLALGLNGPSRSRLKVLIEDGHISRDGATIEDPSYKVKPGEVFHVVMPPPIPAIPKPEAIPLDVVYEDDDLIVVIKPVGMVVHPAAGNWNKTLVNALLHHCGASLSGIGGVLRPGIVHRLDKDTSGLLVVAKNDQAHAGLREQFNSHELERAYKALVWGAPRPLLGTVDAALTRGGPTRQKMVVATKPNRQGARHAVTHYRVMERYGPVEAPIASLVECRLETGRTHQIRVHMGHIGCPVIGDATYGQGRKHLKSASDDEAHGPVQGAQDSLNAFKRQALHAYLIGFDHPISAEKLRFEVDLPFDMKDLANKLELL
jgi:23S rRNA pseudouridine1911/1915/1917 synthase